MKKSTYILGGMHLFLESCIDGTSGMFILSKTNRDWLMTELPAGEIPLELKMRSLRKETINLSQKFRIELS